MGIGLMKVYGHGGGIDGFSSVSVYFPEEKITASYMANASDYPMNILFQGAMKIVAGQDYKLPK